MKIENHFVIVWMWSRYFIKLKNSLGYLDASNLRSCLCVFPYHVTVYIFCFLQSDFFLSFFFCVWLCLRFMAYFMFHRYIFIAAAIVYRTLTMVTSSIFDILLTNMLIRTTAGPSIVSVFFYRSWFIQSFFVNFVSFYFFHVFVFNTWIKCSDEHKQCQFIMLRIWTVAEGDTIAWLLFFHFGQFGFCIGYLRECKKWDRKTKRERENWNVCFYCFVGEINI